jgi:hypothetical protein
MTFIDRYETPELIIFSVLGKSDYCKYTVRDRPPAQVFHVRGHGYSEWAIAIVRSWEGGGSIDIQSDYGAFSYLWGCIGDRNIYHFLRSLNFDYFMGKTRRDYLEFDCESSIEAIRKDILRARREDTVEAGPAREFWDELDDLKGEQNEGIFSEKVYALGVTGEVYFDYDFPTQQKPTGNCKMFWNGPWQALCEHWKPLEENGGNA